MSRLPLTTREPDAVLAHRDGVAIPVARFLGEVAALAERLPERSRAINLCRDRYRFLRAFAAVIAAGQTNLLPANRLPATVQGLLADYPDAYVLSDDDADLGGRRTCRARLDRTPEPTRAVPRIDGEQLAAIVFTSGSTGHAKAITKPWRTYHDSSAINAAEMGLDQGPLRHLVATVPPQHMYGLETSVLVPLFAPVAASAAQPFTPADIAAALARMPTPRVLVSTPAHLRALADPDLALPAVETIWSATAPLDPAIAAALERQNGTAVAEIYGCSEVGSMARRRPTADTTWTLFRGFTLGATGAGATHADAPHLPAGYTLQDHLEHVGPGRFRVIGRTEDLVNIAGKRASLAELNQALLRIPGVIDGALFAPPEAEDSGRPARLAALVVAPELGADAIRAALRERIDAAFIPRPLYHVTRLPRTETGKLPRSALIAAFEEAGGGALAR